MTHTITISATPGATQAEVLLALRRLVRMAEQDWPAMREAIYRPAVEEDEPACSHCGGNGCWCCRNTGTERTAEDREREARDADARRNAQEQERKDGEGF